MSLAQDMRSRMGVSVPSRKKQEATAKRVSILEACGDPICGGRQPFVSLWSPSSRFYTGTFFFSTIRVTTRSDGRSPRRGTWAGFPSPQSVAITQLLFLLPVRCRGVLRLWPSLDSDKGAGRTAISPVGASSRGHRQFSRWAPSRPRAAWIAALYPNAIFWGSTGLKDGPMATLLLAVVAIALRPLTMRRLACAVALLVVAFLSRPVEGAIGLAMLVVPAAELTRRRWNSSAYSVQQVAPACPALRNSGPGVSGARFRGHPLSANLDASLAGRPTLSLTTGPVAINFIPSPSTLPHALLSPVRGLRPRH